MSSTNARGTSGAVFLIALALLVAANGEALHALLRLWAFGGLEYGFAMLCVSAWLLWRSRDRLRRTELVPDLRGLYLVVPVGFATWLAYAVDVRIAEYALFVLAVAALTWTLLGSAALRVVAAPIAFLFLGLPIWNDFTPALQAMTVRVTGLALEVTGTPVFIDESYIYTPRGTFLVLAGCSGAQYFQAGVTVGALYAYLGFRSLKARVLVLLSFAAIAIFANWLRVYALAFLGVLTDRQHFFFGWGIFVCLLIPGFWLASRLRGIDAAPSSPVAAPESRAALTREPAAFVRPNLGSMIALAALATLALAAGPVAIRPSAPIARIAQSLAPKPAQPPWSGPYPASGDWQPSFRHPDAQASASYRRGEREVTAYCACYLVQRQDAKVINETNTVYDPARWQVRGGYAGSAYREVPLAAGMALRIAETRLENQQTGAERLAWHWYEVGGRNVAQPARAKLAQLLGRLSGRQDAAAFVISTDGRDLDAARLVLMSFVSSNLKALQGACQLITPNST